MGELLVYQRVMGKTKPNTIYAQETRPKKQGLITSIRPCFWGMMVVKNALIRPQYFLEGGVGFYLPATVRSEG